MHHKPFLVAALFLILSLAAGGLAEADAPVFADLGANAPEGTFLEPGAEPVATADSFRNEHVSVTVTRERVDRSDVTVADIRLSSVEYLRRAFGNEEWDGEAERLHAIALRSQAVVAMNGDYASVLSAGLVVANGETLRDTRNRQRDHCLFLRDGRMVLYLRGEMDVEEALSQDVWQAFLFGPALVRDGKAIENIKTNVGPANPRSVIGYYAPGHYCFVQVDGRSSNSRGLTITALAEFMASLGCQAAYNLDGGQSSLMYFRGAIITDPYRGGRQVTDVVYIGR